jgi:Flp pilus assembly protein TadG
VLTRRSLARRAISDRDRESGALAPAVAILLLPLFALGGLVVDGSRYLDARSTAQAYAEEAARAGAMQVDLSQPQLALLPESQVKAAVDAYCRTIEQNSQATRTTGAYIGPGGCAFVGITDDSGVNGGPPMHIVVNVHVTVHVNPWLLDIIPGVGTLSATVQASAEPQQGILENGR